VGTGRGDRPEPAALRHKPELPLSGSSRRPEAGHPPSGANRRCSTMVHVIPMMDDKKTRVFDNTSLFSAECREEKGTHRRIGAPGATPPVTDSGGPSLESIPRSPPPPSEPRPTVRWFPGSRNELPHSVIELAVHRDGWTAESWREHLLYLAGRCEEDHPDRAAELRQAAELMTPTTGHADGA